MPFGLLGKHCAYRVALRRADFAQWDQLLLRLGGVGGEQQRGASGRGGAGTAGMVTADSDGELGEMTAQAKGNLNIFRQGNPTLFYRLSVVPSLACPLCAWPN